MYSVASGIHYSSSGNWYYPASGFPFGEVYIGYGTWKAMAWAAGVDYGAGGAYSSSNLWVRIG